MGCMESVFSIDFYSMKYILSPSSMFVLLSIMYVVIQWAKNYYSPLLECVCVCLSWLHFRSDCLPTDVPAALETEISVK